MRVHRRLRWQSTVRLRTPRHSCLETTFQISARGGGSRLLLVLRIFEVFTMKSAAKYLPIALTLAALTTAWMTPVLAQSVRGQDGNTRDRHFTVTVRWGHLDNYFPDDNPRGQHGSDSPDDH